MTIQPKALSLVSYDIDDSKIKFEETKKGLLNILRDFNCDIEHFGSTAIPGTIGKGMIDVIIAFENESDQLKALEILQKNGYRRGELKKKPDGRFFLCSNQEQSEAGDIHLHLVIKDSPNHLNPILFKDYLIKYPDLVKKYNKIKKEIAESTGFNRKEYTKAKSDFINDVIEKAKKRS